MIHIDKATTPAIQVMADQCRAATMQRKCRTDG
jgi:hypothetical protein